MSPDFKRKNIRLPAEIYLGRKSYFVTTCFNNRQPFGADPNTARWLVEQLQQQAAANGFSIHAYCVMPDHMHLLAEGTDENSDLLKFVHSYKQETAFEFERTSNRRLWQFKFYDHVLRGGANPEAVVWYIWLNPVRKGLCQTPQEFQYLGSFTEQGMKLLHGQLKQDWVPPWKKEQMPGKNRRYTSETQRSQVNARFPNGVSVRCFRM